MRLDFLHSRLGHLKERIDDTEDLINIELDNRRNAILALTLLTTVLTMGEKLCCFVGGKEQKGLTTPRVFVA
jgi:hypothetical protein